MLDTTPAQQPVVREAINGKLPDAIVSGTSTVLLQGDYGVTQLLDWYDNLRPALYGAAEWEGGLAGTDMDDRLNRLTVKVTDEQYQQAVQDAAGAAGVPLSEPNIIIGERDVPTKSLTDKFRPVVAGVQIKSDTSPCTLGFNAVRNGIDGFVMAAHCSEEFSVRDAGYPYRPGV